MSDTTWRTVVEGSDDFIPEEDYVFPIGRANLNTYNKVGMIDIVNSFHNHKNLFMECHPSCYRLPNIASEIGRLLLRWAQVRLGRRAATDIGALGEGGPDGYAGLRPDGTHIPAIIVGSGPSMDTALPYMKDWEGATFCNSSQGGALVRHGCDPTYVDVCDPRIVDWEMQVPYNYKKTSLITHPGMDTTYLEWWKGQKYLTRIYEPGYELYSRIWPMAYNWIPTYTLPFGNQPPWAVSHATAMKYEPIFLVGCDFGFPGGIAGMTRYFKKGLRWHQTNPAPVENRLKHDGNAGLIAKNGVPTCALYAHYRDQMMRIVCLDQPQIFAIKGGIVDWDQMPLVNSIQELIRNQGKGYERLYRTPEEIREQAEKFLAFRRMFFLPFKDGHRFVGMHDWREDLRDMVNILNNTGAGIDYDTEFTRLEELTK